MSSYKRRLTVGRLKIVYALLLATMLTVFVGSEPAHAVEGKSTKCEEVGVPVNVAGQQGTMRGTLCVPDGASTLQILVHGHTYKRNFWDSPYKPGTYSYTKHMNDAGYATLAIDRLGVGKSFRPSSPLVTYDTTVETTHAFVNAAHAGQLGYPFSKVALVGHSMGSGIVYGVAGKYQDVDAVVAAGGGHEANLDYIARFFVPQLRPAELDPRFAGQGYDPGYITHADHNIFVNRENTSPEMLRLNQTTFKAADSLVALGTYVAAFAEHRTMLNLSKNINVPTFTINGQRDPFFCRAPSLMPGALRDYPLQAPDCSSAKSLRNFERPFYGPRAGVETAVVPNAGHGVMIERTAPEFINSIASFLNQHEVD